MSDDVTTTTRTKPRRRLLRFSLRTFLLFMLVCGVALIPLVWKLEKAKKQREAVAWVLEMGGNVTYAIDDPVADVEPRGTEWLRYWLVVCHCRVY